VALEVATQPGFAEVLVQDTGAGFRPEDVPNLFRPFSRLHGATLPGVAGTGLGLYIAKGIVSQWGGVLRGASGGPGQGACFAFTVPLASA
jgi:signal transduction histidine kinase